MRFYFNWSHTWCAQLPRALFITMMEAEYGGAFREEKTAILDAFLKACLIYTNRSQAQEWRNYRAPHLKKWGTARHSTWQQSTFEEKRFYKGL